MGNCEVFSLAPGEDATTTSRIAASTSDRQRRHRERHHRHWQQMHAEREMWMRTTDRQRWMPWWLMSRMRRRMFVVRDHVRRRRRDRRRTCGRSRTGGTSRSSFGDRVVVSGGVAFRLTRPLMFAIKAATDIGDGKLETRIDPLDHSGEMRVLAKALNDMATQDPDPAHAISASCSRRSRTSCARRSVTCACSSRRRATPAT